jgi:hypothetical protein
MKHLYIFISILIVILVPVDLYPQNIQADIQNCASNAGKDAIYLKDFVVKLEGAKPNQKPPVFRATLALRKGVLYRLNVCNNSYSEAQPLLHLYDESVLLLSTFNSQTGKEYRAVTFECKKSGAYTIVISFREGKPGEAIGILSYVNK